MGCSDHLRTLGVFAQVCRHDAAAVYTKHLVHKSVRLMSNDVLSTYRHLSTDALIGRPLTEMCVDLLEQLSDIRKEFFRHCCPEIPNLGLKILSVYDIVQVRLSNDDVAQSSRVGDAQECLPCVLVALHKTTPAEVPTNPWPVIL
jgi:hypothetical protein